MLLGPGVNIKRSPLAGRNFEYFSEDPYLTGELAIAYIKGVQSTGVGVSVKHFAANNRENQRFTSSSNIDERAFREIYLSAFERIVKNTDPATIMCSYNAINGTLNSQNQRLLTKILRDEWGFNGLVMSDWGAVADNVSALKAGLDLEMPGKGLASSQEIIDAIKSGRLSEDTLNCSVLRVVKMIKKWGQHEEHVSYNFDEQHQFARNLADKSIVLLKNKNSVLPLDSENSIAIIGQLAEKPRYQGGGSSHVNAYNVVTPLQALKLLGIRNSYQPGYDLNSKKTNQIFEDHALKLAQSSEQIVFFAGFPESYESEGFDKTSIQLPNNQNHLIKN